MRRILLMIGVMGWVILATAAPVRSDAGGDLGEYLARQARLAAADVAGRVTLAGWCRDKEMWEQMKDLAQEVLEREPESRVAYNLLREYDEKVQLPVDEELEKQLQREFKKRFGRDFKTRTSRHFVLVYDTSETFVNLRSGHLEKAYDAFLYWFNLQKLHPAFLRQRLVVVLFAQREDYLTYARQVDKQDVKWAAGYYAQRSNRSVFYDEATGPQAQQIESKLETLREMVRDLNNQIDQARRAGQTGLANTLTAERNDINQKMVQINNQVENQVGLNNMTKTVHEASHMLSFNTGIQKRIVEYPLWLSEGIAASFETADRLGTRGPGVVHGRYAAKVKEAWKKGQLPPLEDFMFTSAEGKDAELVYAESWALLHYLYKTNRAGLEKFLSLYLALPADKEVTEKQRRELFTQAFGEDVKGLENRFAEMIKDFPGRVER